MICVTQLVASICSFVTLQADDAQMPICYAGQDQPMSAGSQVD